MAKIQFGSPIYFEIQEEVLPQEFLLETQVNRNQNFIVYILKSAYDQMKNHVNNSPRAETGGVLVGYPFMEFNKRTRFLIITSVIEQRGEAPNLYHFTVSPEEIFRSRNILEDLYAGLLFVGWYHSHPGHGVFLSSQDKEIVRSIYDSSWQLSVVFDSVSDKEGIFTGPEGIQIGTSWAFLNQIPDSIKAIALYNQVRESVEENKYSTALFLIKKIEELVKNSNQLSHWKNGYRDINKLRDFVIEKQKNA